MAAKIQEIRKHIQSGNLELARFDENNKPVKMQISELEQKTSELNHHQKIYKLIENLSWEQKFEWVNTRRLKGNHIFKTGSPEQALQCYLESLIGLELKNNDPSKNAQVRLDLQFPILMNMAACFYKLKMYQKGIEICDQVLNDSLGKDYYQALYKKAYFLYEMGSFDKAKQLIFYKDRQIILELNLKIESNSSQKKVSKQDVKELFSKIIYKTKEEKAMYKRIFEQDDNNLLNTNQSHNQQPVLEYNENIFKKTISWVRQALESCYRAKPKEYHLMDEDEKSRLLPNKKK